MAFRLYCVIEYAQDYFGELIANFRKTQSADFCNQNPTYGNWIIILT